MSSAKRPVPVMNLGSSTLFRGWPRTAVSSFTTVWTEGNGLDVPNAIRKDFTEVARHRVRRLNPKSFEYHAPKSVEEASSLAEKYGMDASFLAGGQSVIPL